jgi:Ca-activated chloride channel family protein
MSTVSPLKIFIRPERRFAAEGRPSELVVVIRLVPAQPAEPVPVSAALVLAPGRTGLLSPDTMAAAVASASASLRPSDRLSVTLCGTRSETTASGTVEEVLARLPGVVRSDVLDGSPDLYAGWLAGALDLSRTWERARLHRVLLVTDGGGAGSARSTDSFVRAAQGLVQRGISTTTFGIGTAFSEQLLAPISIAGGGNAFFAESSDVLILQLKREIAILRATFSEWASMRLELENADLIEMLNELPWLSEGKVALPPLIAGAPFHVGLRIRMRPAEAGTEVAPLTVRIKTLDPAGNEVTTFRKQMRMHVVAPSLADSMAADPAAQAHAARLELLRANRRCIQRLDEGNFDGARELLDFSLARFRKLQGSEGGTLLSREMQTMLRIRERIPDRAQASLVRKLFVYSGLGTMRSDLDDPDAPGQPVR